MQKVSYRNKTILIAPDTGRQPGFYGPNDEIDGDVARRAGISNTICRYKRKRVSKGFAEISMNDVARNMFASLDAVDLVACASRTRTSETSQK
ncbi:hypothetical protein KCU76_g79, partial [Aureobasidium melanogenum]